MNQDLSALMREALMCSLFVDPRDPGLDDAEIFEIGRQARFQDGEIRDTFPHVSKEPFGRTRYVPSHHDVLFSTIIEAGDPPLLDVAAADFVKGVLNERIRADGIQRARLDRDVIVARAVAAGHPHAAVEGAITCLAVALQVKLEDGAVVPRQAYGLMELSSGRQRPSPFGPNRVRARVMELVRDVVARRTDGRPRHAEPLDAFPDALERIGFGKFRVWWLQTVSELRGRNPTSAPVACAVLSAALVEGALTFAAKYARDAQVGAFTSSDFDKPPQGWRVEKLIESAAAGGVAAILSPQLKARAEVLNRTRQRVHAGRMLGEHPGGPPDLRPEDGREAKATAEQVVRAVLDWLERPSPVHA